MDRYHFEAKNGTFCYDKIRPRFFADFEKDRSIYLFKFIKYYASANYFYK